MRLAAFAGVAGTVAKRIVLSCDDLLIDDVLPTGAAPECGVSQAENHAAVDTRSVALDDLFLNPILNVPAIY